MTDHKWNYDEDILLDEVYEYIKSTYNKHYATDKHEFQTVDAWEARGTALGTCIDTALKYAMRYGKKNGYNRNDLLKLIHYAILALHYHSKESGSLRGEDIK